MFWLSSYQLRKATSTSWLTSSYPAKPAYHQLHFQAGQAGIAGSCSRMPLLTQDHLLWAIRFLQSAPYLQCILPVQCGLQCGGEACCEKKQTTCTLASMVDYPLIKVMEAINIRTQKRKLFDLGFHILLSRISCKLILVFYALSFSLFQLKETEAACWGVSCHEKLGKRTLLLSTMPHSKNAVLLLTVQ